MQDSDVATLSRSLMKQHRDVLAGARGVETMVELGHAATGDVARRLEELANLVEWHVSEEESSPLYQEFPERYPALARDLSKLRASHAPLCAELRELCVACGSATSLELDSPVSIRIRAAIAALRQHEADEAAILAEARDRVEESG